MTNQYIHSYTKEACTHLTFVDASMHVTAVDSGIPYTIHVLEYIIRRTYKYDLFCQVDGPNVPGDYADVLLN